MLIARWKSRKTGVIPEQTGPWSGYSRGDFSWSFSAPRPDMLPDPSSLPGVLGFRVALHWRQCWVSKGKLQTWWALHVWGYYSGWQDLNSENHIITTVYHMWCLNICESSVPRISGCQNLQIKTPNLWTWLVLHSSQVLMAMEAMLPWPSEVLHRFLLNFHQTVASLWGTWGPWVPRSRGDKLESPKSQKMLKHWNRLDIHIRLYTIR